jgi:alpha-tubulin suppressor-like RCC1 family protein
VLAGWGYGRGYSLGYDSAGLSYAPERLVPDPAGDGSTPLAGFTQIYAGGRGAEGSTITATATTCGVRNETELWCWGENHEGQLGRAGSSGQNLPARVLGLPEGEAIVDVGIGHEHTCAAFANGRAYCWGLNTDGQLGDGTQTSRYQPDNVDNLSGIVRISAGRATTCAATEAGELHCWGGNQEGQLGIGDEARSFVLPQRVADWTDVVDVASYTDHSCTRHMDGSVHCWGVNGHGKIGNGTPSTSAERTPVEILAAGSGVVDVDVGLGFTCALTDTSEVLCWGSNWAGQSGAAGTGNLHVPTHKDTSAIGDPIVSLDLGSPFACVRSVGATSRVWCWGSNNGGSLGRGDEVLMMDAQPAIVVGLLDPAGG